MIDFIENISFTNKKKGHNLRGWNGGKRTKNDTNNIQKSALRNVDEIDK